MLLYSEGGEPKCGRVPQCEAGSGAVDDPYLASLAQRLLGHMALEHVPADDNFDWSDLGYQLLCQLQRLWQLDHLQCIVE